MEYPRYTRLLSSTLQIAVVVATADPRPVLERFAALPQIVAIIDQDDRRAVGVTVEGVPVELVLHFKPLMTPHNLTCDHADAGINIDKSISFISFDHTKHVKFTPTKAGEYEFFCGVDSHMKKGMTGTIVVRSHG